MKTYLSAKSSIGAAVLCFALFILPFKIHAAGGCTNCEFITTPSGFVVVPAGQQTTFDVSRCDCGSDGTNDFFPYGGSAIPGFDYIWDASSAVSGSCCAFSCADVYFGT